MAGLALLAGLFCCQLSCPARAATFQDIYNFYQTPGNYPAGGLSLGTDGNFYGTTYAGGQYGFGTVFKVTPDGALTTLANFSGGTNDLLGGAGAHPRGTMVQDSSGNLYGVTYSGGGNNAGTVFKVTLAGALTTLYQFATNPAYGYNPYGGLLKGADGDFYGTTETFGTIFKITPAGVFTPISSSFGAGGYSLECSLAQGPDGNLYGAAGLKTFNQQGGIIFKCSTIGAVSVLAEFNGTNGDQPYGGLVQAGDGKFYGTTTGGGLYGDGTIFSVTTNGWLTKLFDFNGLNGAFPFAPLTLGTDGNIYGSTVGGGSQGQGTLFKISTSGAFTSFFSFFGTNGSGVDGKLLQYGGNTFYGTTRWGGANGLGTVFGITTSGFITMLASFAANTGEVPNGSLIQDTNGNFDGTTAIGGAYGFGSVFQMSSNGVVTTLASFTNSIEGSTPNGPLLLASDGNFYGTTYYGGASNNGTVYQLTPGGALNTLFSFTYTNGANPNSGVIQGGDGTFYGVTVDGGLGPPPSQNDLGGYGTLFNITSNGTLTTLAYFTGTNGSKPQGIMQANDGNFYGTTYYGGSTNSGTVFQLTADGVLNSLLSFVGSNGANPAGGLVEGNPDGALYGTTSSGGAWGYGTVFKITTGGTLTTLANFAETNGATPLGALIQGSDGNFYGTTEFGGDNNLGTIFEVTGDGTLTVIHSFSPADGDKPEAGLLQGSDGYLYGTAWAGGSTGEGSIFRIYPPDQIPSLQISFVGGQAQLSWPLSATGFVLESNPQLGTTNWTAVTDTPTTNGVQIVLPEPIGGANLFYRLRHP